MKIAPHSGCGAFESGAGASRGRPRAAGGHRARPTDSDADPAVVAASRRHSRLSQACWVQSAQTSCPPPTTMAEVDAGDVEASKTKSFIAPAARDGLGASLHAYQPGGRHRAARIRCTCPDRSQPTSPTVKARWRGKRRFICPSRIRCYSYLAQAACSTRIGTEADPGSEERRPTAALSSRRRPLRDAAGLQRKARCHRAPTKRMAATWLAENTPASFAKVLKKTQRRFRAA